MDSWLVGLGLYLVLGVAALFLRRAVLRSVRQRKGEDPTEDVMAPNAAWNQLDEYIARSQGGQRLR